MKKVFLLLIITFSLTSCWNIKEQWVIEETDQILNDYADTLEWSIQDAKSAKKLIEQNNQKLKNNLNIY